jgi:4-amino-4-deoxy-L-arabinose transferase-like glycosyltransferase
MRTGNDALILAATSAFFVVAFFSISSTKLPSYVSPALPFMALVTGFYLDRGLESLSLPRWPWVLSFILGLGLVIGVYFGLANDPNLKEMPWLAFYFLPMPVGAGLGLYFGWKKLHRKAILWNAAGFMTATLLFHMLAFPVADAQNPVAQSLHLLEGKEVVVYKRFNPSYAFYLDTPLQEFHTPEELDSFLEENPDVRILSTKKHLEELESISKLEVIFARKDLFERPTSVILTYRK